MSHDPGIHHSDETVARFIQQHGADCAYRVTTLWQKLRYLVLFAAIAVFVLYWKYIDVLNFLICALYGAVIFYKLFTVILAVIKKREIVIPPAETAALREDELPVYTVLVPMYREQGVAAKLIQAVGNLDYPHDKLDIKVLLEADDPETIAECRELRTPFAVETIVVPDTKPKTKPRACNWGLGAARGEFLVIYDAEDRPEPDQLRKAVAAFRRQPEKVVCLQAKLNYYNPRQNWLTKFFTLEYTAWFDLYLPGLHALNVPIPLGGTSNHFRTAALRELGGWDPFNVTEDCDLGVRLERAGYRTKILESTTWEEANSRLGNWIRQRSRWVKGYIQTHLVHTRSRFRTLRGLGVKNYVSFLLTVGGLPAVLLLNPIYWIVAGVFLSRVTQTEAGMRIGWQMWFDQPASEEAGLRGLGNVYVSVWNWITGHNDVSLADLGNIPFGNYTSQIFFPITVALVASNLFLILVHVIACRRRGLGDLIGWCLLIPLYWVLISIGAWKGFLQLLTRPFYWEKTEHGLTGQEPPGAAPLPEELSPG
ncbi:MAG: glycosyltransferase family 2 protein [Planctomycetota bacterium]|jgi:cellulose synthase/poly-beta-1,6-N-acetylglucosamine synthase-like glycosyltransferase